MQYEVRKNIKLLRVVQYAHFLANIGFETAENGPLKTLGTIHVLKHYNTSYLESRQATLFQDVLCFGKHASQDLQYSLTSWLFSRMTDGTDCASI